MRCRCSERRDRLAVAVKAARAGRADLAKGEIKAVGRTLTEDARTFARALQTRLVRR